MPKKKNFNQQINNYKLKELIKLWAIIKIQKMWKKYKKIIRFKLLDKEKIFKSILTEEYLINNTINIEYFLKNYLNGWGRQEGITYTIRMTGCIPDINIISYLRHLKNKKKGTCLRGKIIYKGGIVYDADIEYKILYDLTKEEENICHKLFFNKIFYYKYFLEPYKYKNNIPHIIKLNKSNINKTALKDMITDLNGTVYRIPPNGNYIRQFKKESFIICDNPKCKLMYNYIINYFNDISEYLYNFSIYDSIFIKECYYNVSIILDYLNNYSIYTHNSCKKNIRDYCGDYNMCYECLSNIVYIDNNIPLFGY